MVYVYLKYKTKKIKENSQKLYTHMHFQRIYLFSTSINRGG